jgi:Penicillin-insensitive murein endopeptidase
VRSRFAVALAGAMLCAVPAAAQVAPPDPDPTVARLGAPHSVAVGHPWDGFLEHGVQLPEEGPDFVTWDPVLHQSPDRGWRRWGTQELLAVLESVAREFRAAHPGVPRLLISDLSRPHGGPFGREYGGLGHASHQNGLDADVMCPRRDGLLRAPMRPSQVDRALTQDLVDRFVRAGAVKLFVGPHLDLRGPRDVVVALAHHDDHVHVRIPAPPGE